MRSSSIGVDADQDWGRLAGLLVDSSEAGAVGELVCIDLQSDHSVCEVLLVFWCDSGCQCAFRLQRGFHELPHVCRVGVDGRGGVSSLYGV